MLFSNFRRNRAIKKYCLLAPHLNKRYGKDDNYTFLQVKKTAEVMKVSRKFMEYLYALYLDSSEFSTNVSSIKTYDELRTEIANLYFHSNKEFSVEDITEFITPTPWGGGKVDIIRTEGSTFRQ